MIEKALTFGGWPGLALLLSGTVIGLLAWTTCVVLGRFRYALYVTIAMFPFTFYAGRAAGLVAYDNGDFDQRVGMTTFLIIALFFAIVFTGRLQRPQHRLSRWVEFSLWVFAITLTAGQFVSHTPASAFLLSIGAAWQYVALFYLLTTLIRRDRDCFGLLNSIFVCSIFNIVVRVIAKGERLIVPLSSATVGDATTFGQEAGRVGSGALGPGVSYAGYLAILLTFALAAYLLTRRWWYLPYMAVLFLELLNTFTRGGIFILGVLGLLVLFKGARRRMWKPILAGVLAVILAWRFIYAYAVLRGFSFHVMQVDSFSLRVELIKRFFDEYQFNWAGVGILKNTMFELAPWLIVPVHNAYLEILDTCGVLPFLSFVLLSLIVVIIAIRLCRSTAFSRNVFARRLAPFALVAVVQWILFANTTATSILAYYPYEGTAVFWIVACLPLLLLEIQRRERIVLATPVVARPRVVSISTDRAARAY